MNNIKGTKNQEIGGEDLIKGIGIIVVAIIIICTLFSALFSTCDDDNEPELTEVEIRQQKIRHLFHPWKGYHYNLTETVKSAINDPNSFEHLDTKYLDKDSVLEVHMDFTEKNGFGGRVRHQIIVLSDLEGNIVKIIKDIN